MSAVADPSFRYAAVYRFRFASGEDAAAVYGSLEVERRDRIPKVEADVARGAEPEVIEVTLRSSDLGDLRAATKSFLTRVRAAAGVLENASAD